MDFDDVEDQSINVIKQEYGIKQTTELMRFLIRQKSKEIMRSNSNITNSNLASTDS